MSYYGIPMPPQFEYNPMSYEISNQTDIPSWDGTIGGDAIPLKQIYFQPSYTKMRMRNMYGKGYMKSYNKIIKTFKK